VADLAEQPAERRDPPVTPAEAWQRLTDVARNQTELFDRSPEEFLTYLNPFMTNPERHRRHVDMIVSAYSAANFARTARRLMGPAFKPMRRMLRRYENRQLLEKLAELERSLAEVQPGRVVVDVLPPRSLPAHPDYAAKGIRLEALEVKVAVLPNEGFDPTSLSVTAILHDEQARFSDHYPKNEFPELGPREISVSAEGKFLESTSESSKLGSELGVSGAKVSAETSATVSTETTLTRAQSFKQTYTPSVKKVISHGVGQEAQWQVLATHRDLPVGGQDFWATVMVEGPPRTIPLAIAAQVRIKNWGDLRVTKDAGLNVGDPAA